MAHEVALFWALFAAFLVADNLTLLPPGGDVLRFGFAGRLHYPAAARLQMLGRDLIVLNPLNPFDRLAVTSRSMGPSSRVESRAALRALRRPLRGANALSAIGLVYLVAATVLAAASLRLPFGEVLLLLLVLHLVAWAAAAATLVATRARLGLSGARLAGLVTEALFVPAYTINLGKRVWFRRTLNLPALALGLRELARTGDPSRRELLAHMLRQRLDTLEQKLAPSPGDVRRNWIEEARRCLTDLAPSNGS